MNLQQIFKKQHELNLKSNPDYERFFSELLKMKEMAPIGDFDLEIDQFRTDLITKYLVAMQVEMTELLDSMPWKWWKKGEFNLQNARVEAVDILHFLVSIMILLDMNADMVFDLYEKKNKLNHKRQNEGYKTGEYQKIVDGREDNECVS